ncbi:MAG: type II secretion system GspH family protein [Planctomycetota bacterium]|nr:type II secretion system GspH family protein [Planctomycetota bacterium]
MNRGFTLTELIVAIAIMLIIIGVLTYLYSGARRTFADCMETTELYHGIRSAFDMIENEIGVAQVTHDMEFFEDALTSKNNHFDETEKWWGLGKNNRIPEFPDTRNKYTPAMTIFGSEYTDNNNTRRRADMLYFKGITMVAGKKREALILYRLDTSNKEMPILKKYVLYKADPGSGKDYVEEPSDGSGQDICIGVTDIMIEYFYDDPLDSKPPNFYSVGVGQRKVFCYSGRAKIDGSRILSVPDANGKGFDDPTSDKFRQISPGANIFLFDGYPKSQTHWQTSCDGDYQVLNIKYDASLNPQVEFAKRWPMLPANITSVGFRVGYLPKALRITMRVITRRGATGRTVSRIISIRSI